MWARPSLRNEGLHDGQIPPYAYVMRCLYETSEETLQLQRETKN